MCRFTGKKANRANKVSFSNHKTKKLQFVNLQYKRVWWEAGKRFLKLRLSTKALKTIEKNGLDAVAKKAGIDLRKEWGCHTFVEPIPTIWTNLTWSLIIKIRVLLCSNLPVSEKLASLPAKWRSLFFLGYYQQAMSSQTEWFLFDSWSLSRNFWESAANLSRIIIEKTL